MKFVDVAKIKVKAGNGGNGAVAFLRELYVPKGGPAGGDGGRGGSVIFVGDEGMNTLLDLKYQKELRADDGENGDIKNMHGHNAKNTYVSVPLGTILLNSDTNEVIGDIVAHKQEIVIAKGGKGGRGNARFATSRNKAPTIFENGDFGEIVNLTCELKVLADVGLVGLPNAGKSTLLSVMSNSRPQIGEYPFTTITPQLGVVRVDDKHSFVLADLPGLIENAHLGKGLGIQFLKHIERCAIIVYLLDMSGNYGSEDVWENYLLVRNELKSYNSSLLERTKIIVANKMDVENSAENLVEFKAKLNDDNVPLISVSGLMKTNLEDLKALIYNALTAERERQAAMEETVLHDQSTAPSHKLYEFKEKAVDVKITNLGNHVWQVTGEDVARIYHKMPTSTYDNLLLFNNRLKQLGVFDKLREKGAQTGDVVRIFEMELEWDE